jgi:fatty acid desaturase
MNCREKINDFNLRQFKDDLRNQAFYASVLRKELPKKIFKPVPQRLLWLPLHFAIIAACVFYITRINNQMVNPFFAIMIGHSLAVIFFLGHEIAHGCVVKNKTLIIFLSSICFIPFGLYGKAFISWHNRKHHHATQHPFKDPDCFGKHHLRNNCIRQMANCLPGSNTLLSYTFLFWFFSFYTLFIVWFQPNIFINKKEKIGSRVFSIISYLACGFGAIYFYPLGLLYFLVIPMLVANFVVMIYLSTNHFLNPLTKEVNDPLVNSLTVDTWKIFRILHLNINYHAEHHVFPYVSGKYAPMIAKKLKEKFAAKYNHMPHKKALKLLYQRPKFYYDDVTFINPVTQEKFPTIIVDELI